MIQSIYMCVIVQMGPFEGLLWYILKLKRFINQNIRFVGMHVCTCHTSPEWPGLWMNNRFKINCILHPFWAVLEFEVWSVCLHSVPICTFHLIFACAANQRSHLHEYLVNLAVFNAHLPFNSFNENQYNINISWYYSPPTFINV